MPRLEDGELVAPTSKFKKRRAWIIPDDPTPIISQASAQKKAQDGLSITRVEHDYNMSVTRVEQKIPYNEDIYSNSNLRLEHDYNKSVTRLEHDCNMIVTDLELGSLFAFINKQRIEVLDFEDELQYLILNLSDVQKRVFWHVALECLNRNSPRTRPMEIKSFFEKLDISMPVIRTTLNRLVDKRLLQREKGKLGKNGFAIISLSRVTFDAVGVIYKKFQTQSAN